MTAARASRGSGGAVAVVLPPSHRIQALLGGALAGDRAAEDRLLREVVIPVVKVAVSRRCLGRAQRFFTREEWRQKVVLHLYEGDWAKLRQYNPGHGPLAAWLFGVADHQIRDEIRRREPPTPEVDGDKGLAADSGPEIRALLEEAWRRALCALDPASLILFRLHHLEGLPRGQIADRLGMSMASVHKRIQAMDKELKGVLSSPGGTTARRRTRSTGHELTTGFSPTALQIPLAAA
jgi:RNA polymerase sigma factor (sigma-70 family)